MLSISETWVLETRFLTLIGLMQIKIRDDGVKMNIPLACWGFKLQAKGSNIRIRDQDQVDLDSSIRPSTSDLLMSDESDLALQICKMSQLLSIHIIW